MGAKNRDRIPTSHDEALTRPGRQKGIVPDIGYWSFGFVADQGWALEIRCWSKACGSVVTMDGAKLAGRFGRTATIESIESRLTCACGASLPAITAVDPRL
jgi:hypothetical protein